MTPPTPHSTVPTHKGVPSPEGAELWLRSCYRDAIPATLADRLGSLTPSMLAALEDPNQRRALSAFAAMAAMGRGDYVLADRLLGPPPTAADSPERPDPASTLLDLSIRLYRACGEAERDPKRAVSAMEAVDLALRATASLSTQEVDTARGYAGLTLGEALLMLGDIGAARLQLEKTIEEGKAPPVLLLSIHCILAGIEEAGGRSDLVTSHLQAALRLASALPSEQALVRLLLIFALLGTDLRYGVVLYEEWQQQGTTLQSGQGTVARLSKLVGLVVDISGVHHQTTGQAVPFDLQSRLELREILRHLQSRHYSAGWFLLFTGLAASALRGAGDFCEAYSILVQAAATLRCRRMDGAADLCDRQIEGLRIQLGEDRFEALLTEARHRRQLLSAS